MKNCFKVLRGRREKREEKSAAGGNFLVPLSRVTMEAKRASIKNYTIRRNSSFN